mmetsp:Transcript_13511/g.24953  ORF Transcript_13511/g.24953 Transcript_13511/m.24953 type:complete len:84 (+) Transcript_13511:2-253(+)
MKRFRLTRFGWERRRSGFNGHRRRLLSWQLKRNRRKIEYLHRVDIIKLVKTAKYHKLKIRDFPRDDRNPNMKPSRLLVPAHFG